LALRASGGRVAELVRITVETVVPRGRIRGIGAAQLPVTGRDEVTVRR